MPMGWAYLVCVNVGYARRKDEPDWRGRADEVNIDLAPLGYLSKLDRTGSATQKFLAHIRSGN